MAFRSLGKKATPLILALAVFPAGAAADDLPEPVPLTLQCNGEFLTQVFIDGLQSDWEAEAPPVERVQQLVEGAYRYDWTGPVDASFMLWCRYTDNGLYFAVVGRDNIITAPEGSDPGDTFEVFFEIDAPELPPEERRFGARVPLWNVEDTLTPEWAPGSALSGEINAGRSAAAPRENGYFVEFDIPYIAAENLDEPFAPIRFVAAHRDWDGDANREELAIVATAPYDREDSSTWGTLEFTGPEALVRHIAEERGAEGAAPFARTFADVGGTAVRDLVMIFDGQLIVTGEGFDDFAWTSVLVVPTEDVTPLGLETHDIDHDGRQEIFVTTRRAERSLDFEGTVYQEFLTVYALRGVELVPILEQEIANELESGERFAMEMVLRERSDRTVVRFRRPESSTLSREAWIDVDAAIDTDYEPVLTPWGARSVINWDLTADGRWVVLPPE